MTSEDEEFYKDNCLRSCKATCTTTERIPSQVRSGMGARAAAALRRVHPFPPLVRFPPSDRPGLRGAHRPPLHVDSQLAQPRRTRAPRWSAPPRRIPSLKDPIGGVFLREAHHVSVEAQLALAYQAADPSHPRSVEHLLVRHMVPPAVGT